MDIFDYFESLRRSIRQNRVIGFLEQPALMQAFDEHRGLFRARIFFWDDSCLTVDEVIDTQADYPEILRYSYTMSEVTSTFFAMIMRHIIPLWRTLPITDILAWKRFPRPLGNHR